MLEALGSPGERSILSEQRKEGNGEAGSDESWEDRESPEDNEVPEEKRGHEEKPGSHGSVHSEEESSEGRAERRRDEEDDEDLTADKKGESQSLSFHPKLMGASHHQTTVCVGLIEVHQSG